MSVRRQLFTNANKLAAIRREHAYRRYVYPKRVASGQMTKADMEKQIALFEDILADYEALILSEQLPLPNQRT